MRRVWLDIIRLINACAIVLLAMVVPAAAQFIDNTTTTLGNQQICPGGNQNGNAAANPNGFVIKTINVTGVTGNADVMRVGLFAQHTYRGDIRMEMRKGTAGTWTQIIGVTNTAADNYNVEIDQNAAEAINTGDSSATHSLVAPLYQFPVNANATLAAFNTTPANGTWQFRFCDNDFRDNGEIRTVELSFPMDGDLVAEVSVDDPFPAEGGTVNASYTLTNDGFSTQTNITVDVSTSGNVTVNSSAASAGSFSGTTWTVPSLAAGASEVLVLDTTAVSGTITYDMGITGADNPDPVPSNDTASAQASAQPSSTPPPFTCTIGQVYDMSWSLTGPNSWGGGDLTNSYVAVDTDPTTSDIPLTLTMSAPGGNAAATAFFNGAVSTPSPRTRAGWDGGTGGAASLYVGLAFGGAGPNAQVTMTMDLGIPADGVERFQFTISDIDQGSYQDRITVAGFADGNPVSPPILTPGSRLQIIGNAGVARPDGGNAAATEATGNLTVTFTNPVDQIVFTYDNGPAAANPPNTQAIALQDISICRRLLPDIDAVKTVEIYEPANQGDYMTPGNWVEYTIAVTNRGPANSGAAEAAATGIDLADTLPGNLRFQSAQAVDFTGGSLVTTPAANADCGTTACLVEFEGGELDVDETGLIVMRALIK